MPTTNIDDVLAGAGAGGASTQPDSPETLYDEPDSVDAPEPNSEPEPEPESEPERVEEPEAANDAELDDYGNEKAPTKTYTEDEVNERINKAVRDRLSRMEKNQGITQQQAQHAEQNFEYDPKADGDWQQQLKQFVRQTYQETIQEERQQIARQREQQIQSEFEAKFHNGMSKFTDFREVVGQQPITDAMTVATRAMKDPAAFLYAASKRHAPELQRISAIPDQYTQMVEMGKLEERMRKNKSASNAPKPLSRTQEDANVSYKSDKEPTIEDMIAEAEAKKRKILNSRRK